MRKGYERIVNIVSMVLILVFGTLLCERYGLRLDLTAEKLYTLSPATKRLLESLDENINVKVFFSKDMPYPYNTRRRYVIDMLKDYSRLSGGKILLDIVNPKDQLGFEEEARIYGIPSVQMNAIENNQIQIKRVYMGVAFIKGDKIQTIPVIADVNQLEYQITSTIKNLLRETNKTIGILTGHDERPLNVLREYLKKQYEVKNVSAKADELKDLDLLVIAGPRKKFKDEELKAIDQFVVKGGKTLFLIDRVDANPQYGFGKEIKTGLEELLKKYGIEISAALVYDLSSGMINVSERRGGFVFTTIVPYPFFPKIINLNQESIITRNIETITLAFASPIKINNKDKALQIQWLAKTTERSGILEKPYYVAVGRRFIASEFSGPPSTVAVLVEGKIKSGFSNSEDKGLVREGESRFIVVSDSDFASDEMIEAPGNVQFVVNAIDWLAEDDTLISIRSKQVQARPIKQLSPGTQRILKYIIVLFPALLLVVFAALVWVYRRSRRAKL